MGTVVWNLVAEPAQVAVRELHEQTESRSARVMALERWLSAFRCHGIPGPAGNSDNLRRRVRFRNPVTVTRLLRCEMRPANVPLPAARCGPAVGARRGLRLQSG